MVELPWSDVSNNIYDRELIINLLPVNSFYNYESDYFSDVRDVFRDIHNSIKQDKDITEEHLVRISALLDDSIARISTSSDAPNSLHLHLEVALQTIMFKGC
jgi:hypothetical protein